MDFTILNWNIGGAKFLETKQRGDRERQKSDLNQALSSLINKFQPDVVTLQEIVRYKEPDDVEIRDVVDPVPTGYRYFPFDLINSDLMSSKAKWNKVLRGSDWDLKSYFAQGNAFLVKKDSPVFPVWDLSNLAQPRPGTDRDHFVEQVHLDSGLYFGDRNTEPRAALVMHFITDPKIKGKDGWPLDIFVVNVHLTTLMKEREGVPEIDALAEETRLAQLKIVFNGVVSRYNSWRQDGYPQRHERRKPGPTESFDRHSPIWILAGDFNFTENSAEYAWIMRRNFIDTVPDERKTSPYGIGTKAKGVGNDPTLTLDYIFAGPQYVSLDPVIKKAGLHQNYVVHDHDFRASDHYPVFSKLALILPSGD